MNDIVAAATSVAFYEFASRRFYAQADPAFSLWLLQCFKLGFTYALLADACKLGGG